ncbi:hypothetical protein BEN71_15915 [Acinetobacter wuhouensis]|uniref:hypothetical protein n=1 Tax=Acinetobacter wuhouensis TaxID=1879050 RepID=UPI00083AAD5D|nr:hypothetical protein [Acinetobacter wuhouensis]AXQ23462.1 hypothetical protein BEN71_15915 [Acinetobacter wuhouensis]RZG74449.1 hypothetical protein EXE09_12785 [Acinetobacter sp. WCHAc060025]
MNKNLIFLMLLPSFCFAEQSAKFSLNAELYSDPVSVHAFLNDWDSPRLEKGKNAFASGKMKLETQHDHWTMGWVWSYDYQLRFSEDMAKLYYQIKNDQLIDANSNYALELEAQHVDTVGARFGYDWDINSDWKIVTGLTALIGRHYVDGEFQAQGQTSNMPELMDRVKWLNGHLNYSYDEPALKEDELGWNGQTNKGYGYALDLGVKGKLAKNWDIAVQAEDIFSYLYWDNAPFTKYSIRYDQNSRPRMDLAGQLSKTKQYTQKLPYKISSEITYSRNDQPWSLSLTSFSNQYLTLVQMNGFWQYASLKYGVHIEPQTQSLGVSVQHKNFGLKYLTDDLATNDAHRFSTYLYAQYFW